MRTRLLGFTILGLLLVLLIGLPLLHAQMSDFSKPDRFWDSRITIGLPGDDDEGDEDKDEDEQQVSIDDAGIAFIVSSRQIWCRIVSCINTRGTGMQVKISR